MIKYMLDTNICIYIIRNRPVEVFNRFKGLQVSDIGISTITLSEMEYGVAKSLKPDQNKLALAQFLSKIEVLPYDETAAQQYGIIRVRLEKKRTPIGPNDMLIAAHAISLDCVLVTNNENEFRRIIELKVENWAE